MNNNNLISKIVVVGKVEYQDSTEYYITHSDIIKHSNGDIIVCQIDSEGRVFVPKTIYNFQRFIEPSIIKIVKKDESDLIKSKIDFNNLKGVYNLDQLELIANSQINDDNFYDFEDLIRRYRFTMSQEEFSSIKFVEPTREEIDLKPEQETHLIEYFENEEKVKMDLRRLYNDKRLQSFKTKLNLYAFDCAYNGKEFSENGFIDFKIPSQKDGANGIVKDYTAVYYQTDLEKQIGRLKITPNEIYVEIKKNVGVKYYEHSFYESYTKVFENEVLPLSDFEKLFNKSEEKLICCYCDTSKKEMNQLYKAQMIYKKSDTRGFNLEVERFNSNEEYHTDNIDLACYWCNNAKTDEFTKEEFKPIGEQIRKVWLDRLAKI